MAVPKQAQQLSERERALQRSKQIADKRHAERTPEQVNSIYDRWTERNRLAQQRLTKPKANNEAFMQAKHNARSTEYRQELQQRWESAKVVEKAIAEAKRQGVRELDVKRHKRILTDDEIIARLSGGDLTEGSCSSLSIAFAANKGGLNVLDYRGGKSLDFFRDVDVLCDLIDNLGGISRLGYGDIPAANACLKEMHLDKYYYLWTGPHAAIVRKTLNGFEYLELQSPNSQENGWHELNDIELHKRFKVNKKSIQLHIARMIDIEKLYSARKFNQLMRFMNTEKHLQQKGSMGRKR